MVYSAAELNQIINNIISKIPKKNPYLIFEKFNHKNREYYKNNMGFIISKDGRLQGLTSADYDEPPKNYIILFKS